VLEAQKAVKQWSNSGQTVAPRRTGATDTERRRQHCPVYTGQDDGCAVEVWDLAHNIRATVCNVQLIGVQRGLRRLYCVGRSGAEGWPLGR
jgi:hypothetical protein